MDVPEKTYIFVSNDTGQQINVPLDTHIYRAYTLEDAMKAVQNDLKTLNIPNRVMTYAGCKEVKVVKDFLGGAVEIDKIDKIDKIDEVEPIVSVCVDVQDTTIAPEATESLQTNKKRQLVAMAKYLRAEGYEVKIAKLK